VLGCVESSDDLARRVLIVEFHAYRSKRYQPLGFTLPSQFYGFDLVRAAVRRGATIAIVGPSEWHTKIPELRAYPVVPQKFPRKPILSPGNCGDEGFERVLAAVGATRPQPTARASRPRRDPKVAHAHAAATSSARQSRREEAWNGRDFYYSAGESETRNWDDMVKYGFVAAGGGRWYSNTLKQLEPGHRVFACIPKTGYVGVGVVTESAQPVGDFLVEIEGKHVPVLDLPLKTNLGYAKDDPDLRQYLVGVDWIRTRTHQHAFWKPGMYANQNSVTRLRQRFTLEELVREFELAAANDDPS
jgi:hypothetical protein